MNPVNMNNIEKRRFTFFFIVVEYALVLIQKLLKGVHKKLWKLCLMPLISLFKTQPNFCLFGIMQSP